MIVSVSSINFQNIKKQQLKNKNVELAQTKSFSEPIYCQSDVWKVQSLFRLSDIKQKSNVSFNGLVLKPNLFREVAAVETHPNWLKLIAREVELYTKSNETRSEFSRDYDRILHSNAYNRMMGKTQVFSHPSSDITSTRILHVNQVASIAENISDFLGLNSKLTRAIAIGHDVGHTPFGHGGESALSAIIKKHGIQSSYWQGSFWHEKNSLRFLDDIETKLNPQGHEQGLDLTYAVRDGVISHCGEVDENGLRPRNEHIDLRTIQKSNRPQPFTWEGCVVKLSDKIAYLGKDLEDAISNGFLHPKKKQELIELIGEESGLHFGEINNTVLINHFITDLLNHSNPHDGLKFSEQTFKLMNAVKKFNYANIYMPKGKIQGPNYDLAINTIFDHLDGLYDGKNTLSVINKEKEIKPRLMSGFRDWLVKYSDIAPEERAAKKLNNKTLYSIDNPEDYKLSIIEYISSMTDKFAQKSFEEITFFG